MGVLRYRYPNLFTAAQLSRTKGLLSKPLESYSYTVAEEKLCMSRLITYASDEGKAFPMLIGADYNDEVRNQMTLFLVSNYQYLNMNCNCLLIMLLTVAQAFT